jgi:hypothetical protein
MTPTPTSFDGVLASLKAGGGRLCEGLLLLLRGGLTLLRGSGILPAALPTSGNRAGRCARPGIPHDSTHDRTACRATYPRTWGRSCCCSRWLGRLLRRLGRIESALLDCSRIAGGLIVFLRLW